MKHSEEEANKKVEVLLKLNRSLELDLSTLTV
jgi:hypothetical protein